MPDINLHFDGENDINNIPILNLAYLGDSVYEVYVRTKLVSGMKYSPHDIHKASLEYVTSPKQAEALDKIMPHLTQEEISVYKRGRNAKVGSIPKNATTGQYHTATGIETLFAYLFIKNEGGRISELFDIIIGEDNGI